MNRNSKRKRKELSKLRNKDGSKVTVRRPRRRKVAKVACQTYGGRE